MASKNDRYFYKVVNFKFNVVDGDTIDCTLDLGFNVLMSRRFRLSGFDAPETFRPNSEAERSAGKQVTTHVKSLLTSALSTNNLYIKSVGNSDVYGRYLGSLYTFDSNDVGVNINEQIIKFMVENKMTKSDLNLQQSLTADRK